MTCPACQAPTLQPSSSTARIGAAFLVWGASVALLFVFPLTAVLIYIAFKVLVTGERPALQLTAPLALVTLAGTLVAQVATLLVCWWAVSAGGKKPFWTTVGWRWHHQFKWVHAIALALAMLLLAFVFERVLPHGETDFERLLQLSGSVRIAVAILAVLSAPLVEEIVYRGVLFSAIARALNWKLSVIIVTLMFAVVHVPQYWGSPAAIAAIVTLSLVLTLLRAATGQLLPCVATHFVFNGVQAITLLVSPSSKIEPTTTALALRTLGSWIGLDL